MGCFNDTHIGGYRVSAVDQNDVAWHQPFGRYGLYPSTPADTREVLPQGTQSFDGTDSTKFGNEADCGIDHEHGNDCTTFNGFLKIEGECCSHQQERDDRAHELVDEERECAGWFPRDNDIGPEPVQSLGRLSVV